MEENKTLRTERLTFVLEYNSRFSRLTFQYGADFENIYLTFKVCPQSVNYIFPRIFNNSQSIVSLSYEYRSIPGFGLELSPISVFIFSYVVSLSVHPVVNEHLICYGAIKVSLKPIGLSNFGVSKIEYPCRE